MPRTFGPILTIAAACLLLPQPARAAPILPDFASATFVPGAPVDNPYFPLLDPRTRIFTGGDERFELTVLGAGPTILGVPTTMQLDRAFEDGRLVEETFDYFAPDDDAVDEGTTIAVGLAVSIDFGEFDDVIRVLETSALEPDAREFKYYARGQGLILVEEGLDPDLESPELVLALTAVVPEPRSLPLLGLGIAALAIHRRSRISRP